MSLHPEEPQQIDQTTNGGDTGLEKVNEESKETDSQSGRKELGNTETEKENDTKEDTEQLNGSREDNESKEAFDVLVESNRPSISADEEAFTAEIPSVQAKTDQTLLSDISIKENGDLRQEISPEVNGLYPKLSGFTLSSVQPYTFGSLDGQSSIASKPTIISSKGTLDNSPEDTIDKRIYYELYDTSSAKIRTEKQKNDYLQRQMANYYRKRKMLHVLVKETKDEEAEKKYYKHLDELETMNDSLAREQLKIHIESDNLKNKYRHRSEEVNSLFEKLKHGELELAKEFADADPVRDNIRKAIIERCMKGQRIHFANLRKIRLAYIKCRNMLQEKQDALDALDNLGPNLRLFDYEQLKMDNRNLHDKLEEKELELTRIRTKCQNAMQVLAHQREKMAAVNTDIENIGDRLENVNDEYMDSREQLNGLKQEKDLLRCEINKMKEQSGLITKPKLLKDMEGTVNEATDLSQKVENFKHNYDVLKNKVHRIRSLISVVSKTNNVEARIQILKNMFSIKLRDSIISDF